MQLENNKMGFQRESLKMCTRHQSSRLLSHHKITRLNCWEAPNIAHRKVKEDFVLWWKKIALLFQMASNVTVTIHTCHRRYCLHNTVEEITSWSVILSLSKEQVIHELVHGEYRVSCEPSSMFSRPGIYCKMFVWMPSEVYRNGR